MANGVYEVEFAELMNGYPGTSVLDTYKFRMNWESVANVSTNTSTVTFSFDIYAPYNYTSKPFYNQASPKYPVMYISIDGGSNQNLGTTYPGNISGSSATYMPLPIGGASTYSKSLNVTHDADGTKEFSFTLLWACSGMSYGKYYTNNYVSSGTLSNNVTITGTIELDKIDRSVKILTATNFTDEENPVITYSNPAGSSATLLQAAIASGTGTTEVAYRNISKTGSSYTFSLTDAERNALRQAAQNAQSIPVTYYIKSTIGGVTTTVSVQRTFTVVNCNPVLNNPRVQDVNSDTIALTGDANIIVLNESMAEYSFEPVASKQATIVSQFVQSGNKKVDGMSQGVIDDPESHLFVFSATDSRNLTTTVTIEKPYVDYLKPTCYQKVTTELVGETGSTAYVTVYGNYYHGSFGLTNNTLKIEVRHTQNDGTMGDWVDLTPLGYTYDGNTYELQMTVSGLSYSQSYTFQSRVTDKLNFVQSAQYVVKVLPVFDWDNDDFNFNVPINMHGATVLRHNKDAGNTVLSADDGHIYIRPGGTDATYNETIFYPDGSVNFSGPVMVDGVEIGGTPPADYIVEAGTESMGSNGTWYWEKWNSGKAVCYGCRNYGKAATSTAIGNVYRSAMYTQDFPSGLFAAIPDIVHAHVNSRGTLWGGWVLLMSPTASSTGDFAIAHTSNVTLPASYVNFHVIGRWK